MAENFKREIPEGDDHERLVCQDCGFINYENPKVIVGAVVSHRGQVLLCKRAIEPRAGYWTIPAGFMEMGETCREGAAREAMEEAGCELSQLEPIATVLPSAGACTEQVRLFCGRVSSGARRSRELPCRPVVRREDRAPALPGCCA